MCFWKLPAFFSSLKTKNRDDNRNANTVATGSSHWQIFFCYEQWIVVATWRIKGRNSYKYSPWNYFQGLYTLEN